MFKNKIFPYIGAAVIFCVVCFLWTVFSKGTVRTNTIKDKIFQHKPQLVFIGNSTLKDAVNENLFEQQSGIKGMKVTIGGSASAWSYLVFKNALVTAMPKPKLVVFFFRNTFLTWPDYRVTGMYRNFIDQVATTTEPVLDQLAFPNTTYSKDYLLDELFPPYRTREKTRFKLEDAIKKTVAILFGKRRPAVNAAMANVFADRNMNQKLLTKMQLAAERDRRRNAYDFASQVNKSFLPHIIKIAKKNSINIMFVRLKRLEYIDSQRIPVGVKKYIAALKSYLKKHDCPLLDFTYEKSFVKKHYAAGDHMSEAGRLLFTQIFAKAIKPYLCKYGILK